MNAYIAPEKMLEGRTIKKIFMNEDALRFDTDQGPVTFTVDGDCCSHSVFYDFIGVKNILNVGPVLQVECVPLEEGDIPDKKNYQESISCYGYRLTVNHPTLGEISAVFSFRNYSNGYYGGSMCMPSTVDQEVRPEIFDDVLETVAVNDLT